MFAHQFRCSMNECHYVLQLIAKTERATALIKRGACPKARGDGLVDQPAIGQGIQLGIGGLHLNCAQRFPPISMHRLERVLCSSAATGCVDPLSRFGGCPAGAEPKDDDLFLSRVQIECDTQGGACLLYTSPS